MAEIVVLNEWLDERKMLLEGSRFQRAVAWVLVVFLTTYFLLYPQLALSSMLEQKAGPVPVRTGTGFFHVTIF